MDFEWAADEEQESGIPGPVLQSPILAQQVLAASACPTVSLVDW